MPRCEWRSPRSAWRAAAASACPWPRPSEAPAPSRRDAERLGVAERGAQLVRTVARDGVEPEPEQLGSSAAWLTVPVVTLSPLRERFERRRAEQVLDADAVEANVAARPRKRGDLMPGDRHAPGTHAACAGRDVEQFVQARRSLRARCAIVVTHRPARISAARRPRQCRAEIQQRVGGAARWPARRQTAASRPTASSSAQRLGERGARRVGAVGRTEAVRVQRCEHAA
jgi:hypothetical protein